MSPDHRGRRSLAPEPGGCNHYVMARARGRRLRVAPAVQCTRVRLEWLDAPLGSLISSGAVGTVLCLESDLPDPGRQNRAQHSERPVCRLDPFRSRCRNRDPTVPESCPLGRSEEGGWPHRRSLRWGNRRGRLPGLAGCRRLPREARRHQELAEGRYRPGREGPSQQQGDLQHPQGGAYQRQDRVLNRGLVLHQPEQHRSVLRPLHRSGSMGLVRRKAQQKASHSPQGEVVFEVGS